MKNLKKIILSVAAGVVLIGGTLFTINASNDFDSTGVSEVEATMSSEDEAELDKKDQAIEIKDENDIKALEILRGLNKTQATELIQDKQEDCELMREICDMLKNNEFTDEEETIMKNYLDRRFQLLDDYDEETGMENDGRLMEEIRDILGY